MAELLHPRSQLERSTHQKTKKSLGTGFKSKQFKQSRYYNKHTKELHKEQAIYVQDPVRKTWNPARVIDPGDTPRSYVVQTETGAQLQRNRIHFRPDNWSNTSTKNSSNNIPQGSTTMSRVQTSLDVDS